MVGGLCAASRLVTVLLHLNIVMVLGRVLLLGATAAAAEMFTSACSGPYVHVNEEGAEKQVSSEKKNPRGSKGG